MISEWGWAAVWPESKRSGRVVKGQYAGCNASGQPLTKAPRKDPFP